MSDGGTRYFAGVGDERRVVMVREDGVEVDGRRVSADLSTLPGSARQHLRMESHGIRRFPMAADPNCVLS